MPDLRDAIDALDRLVAATEGVAGPDALAEAAEVAARVRRRRGFLADSVVVALIGGTGSGKSSILNAIAGEEVAETGARRPVTTDPLAWIPANPEPGLLRLLDDLGIDATVGHDRSEPTVILDMPDIDSIEPDHRATVSRLVPLVDAVVWVMDPEKYQDRVLHGDYIRPLADYHARFVFALNQIDRVDDDAARALVTDLEWTLRNEGIPEPRVVAVAADPPVGPPRGVDELMAAIAGLGEAKRVVLAKLRLDIEHAARRLAAAAGIDGGATGFTEDWEALRSEVAVSLIERGLGPELRRRVATTGRRSGRAEVALTRRRRTEEVTIGADTRSSGTPASASAIGRFLERLRTRVSPEVAAEIEAVGGRLEEELTGAVRTAAVDQQYRLPTPPAWLRPFAWVRRLGVLAGLLGAVWALDRVRAGGDLLPPLALVVVAVPAVLLPPVMAGRVATRRALGEFDAMRASLADAVSRELDRRIGRPLRDVLRRRAQAVAALSEFELVLRALGSEPS